jgi:glyoxylase-like metal-dependent hydrolase (beta-lactamase superfamily II)
MPAFICCTCGIQYPDTPEPPAACIICQDERQYVGLDGQKWTTLDQLKVGHHNRIVDEEPGLCSFATEPKVAIGQRAFLVQTPGGNVLWDCVSLVDEKATEAIADLGGLKAIAISHPHYYTTCVEWSRTFGGVPVFLHAADRQWVTRPDDAIEFWDGETKPLGDGLTLIRCGGHFEGGTVLHWAAGCGARGALLSGDILQVVPDTRWVSFMYSYPNYIPLNARAIRRIEAAVAPLAFERIYGAFPGMTVREDGRGAVTRSVERYLRAIRD